MAVATPRMNQQDEALRLLAHMYFHWFMNTNTGSVMESVFVQIRDTLYTATSQQDAYEQLTQFAEALGDHESSAWKAYDQARTCVERLIQAGGSVDTIIVGQTDGYRQLCLLCSQDEQNFQRVRFFRTSKRRPLLRLEVGDQRRYSSSQCQLCFQPINPQKFVLLTFGGTERHNRSCTCGRCNRVGTSYLVNIYECEKRTQQVVFPFLQQVAALSRRKGVEYAIKLCLENGWYLFNKDTVLP